jgi:hypothetical protein
MSFELLISERFAERTKFCPSISAEDGIRKPERKLATGN